MPVKLTNVNYSPLHDEMELEVLDEDKLAEHVAYLILGNYLHVKLILNAKRHVIPRSTNTLNCSCPEEIDTNESSAKIQTGWVALSDDKLDCDQSGAYWSEFFCSNTA